ncbi:MAG TPA: YdeI/OmpD-associated family protein [Flavobacteriales bacterium]|nr:YdeI/OmpD-associated family protein [Flavobacteriales bacterium]
MAKKSKQTWKFSGPVERMEGRFAWWYVEFPHDVPTLFGKRGEVRVKTLINGVAADRALMPTKSGIHIIVMGGDLRKKTGIKRVGDMVTIELWLDPDPDRVDVPEELAETLDFMPEMKTAWNKLTPGMQRNMCYWVRTAKTAPTKAKRVAELLKKLESGYFLLSQQERIKRSAKRE